MSTPDMLDRSRPLAERVLRLVNEGGTLAGADYAATLDELLADIAAADELARADWAYTEAEAGYYDDSGNESRWDAVNTTMEAHSAALAAYHERMGGTNAPVA